MKGFALQWNIDLRGKKNTYSKFFLSDYNCFHTVIIYDAKIFFSE